jgi:restriction endonuclease Mrr
MRTNREIANDAAQAAAAEAQPEPKKDAEVIDMPRPSPQTIQLTEVERVSAENLNLKMRLLETEYASAKRQIMDADKAWVARVNARLGVELGMYALDFATGTGKLREEAPPKAAN